MQNVLYSPPGTFSLAHLRFGLQSGYAIPTGMFLFARFAPSKPPFGCSQGIHREKYQAPSSIDLCRESILGHTQSFQVWIPLRLA